MLPDPEVWFASVSDLIMPEIWTAIGFVMGIVAFSGFIRAWRS